VTFVAILQMYISFQNPFSVEVSDTSENLELELIELLYDSFLCSSFNQEGLITFYCFFTSILVL
jgi:hypothetical protein